MLHSFPRTLLFGFVAALAAIPTMLVAGPLVGAGSSRTAMWIAMAVVFVAGQRPRPAVGPAALVGLLCLFVWAGMGDSMPVVGGVAIAVAIGRSGLLTPPDRESPTRRILVEVGIAAVSIGLASWLWAHPVLGEGLALWGFYLGQSLFFLFATTTQEHAPADAFEQAHARALRLLEEPRP